MAQLNNLGFWFVSMASLLPEYQYDIFISMDLLQNKNNFGIGDKIRLNAFIGNQKEPNALAASMDIDTLGSLELLTIPRYCMCGAPFDIESTPNFKKRIKEAGLPWPPRSLIDYPLKDW